MSLSRLPLPSIGRVLEGHVDTSARNASEQEITDASTASNSQASEAPVPAIVPRQIVMKTVDFRGNDLENEEVELFSLKVGFPAEAAADADDAEAVIEEGGPVEVAHVANRHEDEQEHARNRWLDMNLTQWMTAIRRLFPFRLAEVFLRRAGREIAQRFAQR